MRYNFTLFQTHRSDSAPHPLAVCRRSFHTSNPGLAIDFSDDASADRWVMEMLSEHSDGYLRHPSGILRADIWRCAVLFAHGGVYADLDIECLCPLDDLLATAREMGIIREDTEVLLSTDHAVHERQHFRGRRMYMNDFMIALKPGAELFKRYLERIGETSGETIEKLKNDPVMLTGPGILTDLIEEAGGPEALKVGVLPWQWIHPLPDMTLKFPEWEQYDALIRSGDWFLKLETPPFVAHYWWHSYCNSHNMMKMYGELLFQSSGVLVERRLEKFVDLLDKRAETTGTALAEFAERFCGRDSEVNTLVELGVTRSFVTADEPGCLSADKSYWHPKSPEKWDWGAGCVHSRGGGNSGRTGNRL